MVGRMKYRGLGLIVCAFAVFISGCDTSKDRQRRDDARARAGWEVQQDMPLAGKLDLSRPAFLEEYPGDIPKDWPVPACNGYCLRLLYSGEANVVLSGYFPSSANLARFIEAEDAGPDVHISAANLYAYHLEKREVCPETAYHESHNPDGTSFAGQDGRLQMDRLVSLQLAAGHCLIGMPAKLSDASAILAVASSSVWRDDTSVSTRSLTAYVLTDEGVERRYRKAEAQSWYKRERFPNWLAPSPVTIERLDVLDRLRQDVGFALKDVPAANVDFDTTIAKMLADKTIDAKSARWKILPEYFESLSRAKSLTQNDIDRVVQVVTDIRTARHLSGLSYIALRHKAQAAPLAAPMLSIMAATERYGDPSDPSLAAETQRFYVLASTVNNLPGEAIAANEDLMVQVVSDPMRIRETEYLLARLDAIDPREASPVLVQYIGGDSTSEAASAAMLAACRLGQRAPQLRPAVASWIAKHPKTAHERRYRSAPVRQNAEIYLSGKDRECRRL